MKKSLLLTILVLGLSFYGCSNGKSSNTKTTASNNTTSSGYECKGGGEIKHGYQLPPCPDQELNDSTLLGIDSNDNGVRDDVEIWIYHHYDTHKNCTTVKTKDVVYNGTVIGGAVETICADKEMPYHQIVREIAMQWARASQIVIQEPEKARETVEFLSKAGECSFYFEKLAKYNNEPILINDYYLYKELDNIQFNTIKRARAYSEYNFHLSGTSYKPPKTDDNYRSACDFNIDKLLGK
jgi:hypothetical protein